MHPSVFVCGPPKAQHVAVVRSGLFQLFKNQKMSSPPPTLPFLVTSAENKWSLMAFFEFLVHRAAVSVFHGSEWCGPGSLEFLAGRSEALIYQDVHSVRCVHGRENSDNGAWTSAHTHLSEAILVWTSTKPLSLIQEIKRFLASVCHYLESIWLDVWLHITERGLVGSEGPQRYRKGERTLPCLVSFDDL